MKDFKTPLFLLGISLIVSCQPEALSGDEGGSTNSIATIYLLDDDTDNDPMVFLTEGEDFLLGSKQGCFGAESDTLWVYSAKTNESMFIITDDEGDPWIVGDDKNSFFIEMDSISNTLIVLEYNQGDLVECGELEIDSKNLAIKSLIPSTPPEAKIKTLESLALLLGKLGLENAINRFDSIYNNPNYRLVQIGVDSAVMVYDLFEIIVASLSLPATHALGMGYLCTAMCAFVSDYCGLLDALSPPLERKEAFKQYYIDNYGISLRPIEPSDVGFSKATLRGEIHMNRSLRYSVVFSVYSPEKHVDFDLSASSGEEVQAHAESLYPDTEYYYWLAMTFKKHGLTYYVMSDEEDHVVFRTKVPSAATGDVISVTEEIAEVGCSFDAPPGAICGIRIDKERFINTSSTAESVIIDNLEPATEYRYMAYVCCEGEYYYGESKILQTLLPNVTGTWRCREEHVNKWGTVSYVNYSVELNEDGSASYDGGSYESASWFRSVTELRVEIKEMVVSSGSSGIDLRIEFDDPKNPTRGEGSANHWSYSAANGTEGGNGYSLVMTR